MRGRHRRCAGAFLLSGSLAFGCLEDADNPPIFPATNGGAGLGGTAAGGAGASGTANGGAPTGGRRNVAGAETGGTGPSGNAGEGRGGGDSGEGGAAGAAAPAIVNCVAKAEVAQDTYTDSLYADCRVEGVVRSTGPRLIEFYQQVFNWTKRFWGCEASGEELEFELVFEANALTQADVDLLIELYVEACDRALVLSAADEAEMRARLARIAEPVVVNPSENTYSMSLCQAGTGGVGGAGGAGAGAGAGGAGGSPEIGGAGGATAGGDGGRQSL